MKIAFSAGPQAAEKYLDFARTHGFGWIDISGSSPENFPETFDSARVKSLHHVRATPQGRRASDVGRASAPTGARAEVVGGPARR